MNTLMNWKPMEFFKRGSDMMVTPNGRINDTGQGILQLFEGGPETRQEDHSRVNYSSQVLKKLKSLRG